MNTALARFPSHFPQRLPSPTDFSAYARAANDMPFLSEDEERACVSAWNESRDQEAARRLVLSHLRLVIRVVKGHEGYGLSPGDLAQEGTVGLMKAVHRFSPAVGVRLAIYAIRWIEAEIREFIFRNLRQVRLSSTKSLRKLFFGYRQAVQRLQAWTGEVRATTLTPQEWAQALGVSEDDVHQIEQYFGGQDQSLMMTLDTDGDTGTVKAQERPLRDRLPTPFQSHDELANDPAMVVEILDEDSQTTALHQAMSELSPRDQAIVKSRWLTTPPRGLAELGREWGISAERVRQVEMQAVKRLRHLMA